MNIFDRIQTVDFRILDWIQANLRSDAMDTIMQIFSFLAEYGWLWILTAVVCLVLPEKRRLGAAIGLALIIESVVINIFLKNMVCRTRPYDINTSIALIIEPQNDYSFPSGHSAASFAASVAIYRFSKPVGIISLVIAAIISFSRLYLYVHFPSDVLAGIIIGVLAGIAAVRIVRTKAMEEKLFQKIEGKRLFKRK